MHITLYRKYRPKDFEELAGQKEIVKTLKASLKNKKTSHAYLFSGPRGLGKTTTARLIAKGVNCLENDITDEPCNTCANCKAINDGTFIDMIEIDAASNRGIDEIRQLKEKIHYQPSSGRKKIYIIDEAHMLTKEAFNALLKTLEEPPDHVIFILATTEPDKILSTIISRCQRYDFKPVFVNEMRERLSYIATEEKIDIDEDVYDVIYESSSGGMRDSISILERLMITCLGEKITLENCEKILGITPTKKMKDFLETILNKNMRDAFKKLEEYWNESMDIEAFFKDFAKYCKNLISKDEISTEDGLHIIGCVYDGINKFKYEEDKRLVGYVIVNKILNEKKDVEIRERIIEKEIEKVVHVGGNSTDNSSIPEDINVTIEEVKSKWIDMIKEARDKKITLSVFLKGAEPHHMDKNILYIAFDRKDNFAKESMEQKNYNETFLEIVRNRIHPKIFIHYMVIDNKTPTKSKNKSSSTQDIVDFFNGTSV
ncbi:DNA polymerase III subunit gamma/tau [Fusobacterium sp. PH5-44]|uniref:DNA polymerase III subunit gamma/tau n=1 Tax=unclassified Fusobacterium TaxID=2648384 RepID=UPI003D1AE07C